MKKTLVLITMLAIVMSIAAGLWSKRGKRLQTELDDVSLTDLIDDNDEGFSRTNTPWHFQFPRDHGAHPDYKTESWYLTGYLVTAAGRRFGFQLTFFRLGLKPPGTVLRDSAWATSEIYRGHFALTDVASDRFYAAERFSRAALGLSGSQQNPVRVWLENWEMKFMHDDKDLPGFLVRASGADIDVELDMQSLKPAILSGGNRRSDEERVSSASFHSYILTRVHNRGTIRVGTEVFQGEGLAWLDRAWGQIPLPAGPIVWDRFLLQLDDNSEIMGFKLRRRAGGGKPMSTGMWIKPDGSIQRFGQNEVIINSLDDWKNPRDSTHYPARWQFRIPSISMKLEIIPHVADQAIDHSMRYWGGAVHARGEFIGKPIDGQGFVELTGYAKR